MTHAPLLLLFALAATDPATLLERARQRLAANSEALSRYACTQTVERELWAANVKLKRPTCRQIADAAPKYEFYARDRLRLDLVVADSRETHQWVNGEAIPPDQRELLVSGGALGTGDFSAFMHTIFARPLTVIEFDREIRGANGPEYRYRYTVPTFASAYALQIAGTSTIVGYGGTFTLDAATGDLRQLRVDADDSARDQGWCTVTTDVAFGHVTIRGVDVLLPASTRLLTEMGALRTTNVTHYSQCREFSAQSTLHFDLTETSVEQRTTLARPYPRDTLVTLKLETPIDSRTSSVGDEVRARADDRTGALFHGRILSLSEQDHPRRGVNIRVVFDQVEVDGKRQPVSLRFASARPMWFPLEKRVTLHKGWQSKWIVR